MGKKLKQVTHDKKQIILTNKTRPQIRLLDLLRAQEVSLSNLRFLSAQFLRYPEFVRYRSFIPSANPPSWIIRGVGGVTSDRHLTG